MTDTSAESKNLTSQTTTAPVLTFDDRLNGGIEQSRNFLLARQNEKGFWVDELESNVTITAELIFFMHFTDTVDLDRQAKIANYLFDKQRDDGSWPLFYGGPCDINSTVESYMALKLAGQVHTFSARCMAFLPNCAKPLLTPYRSACHKDSHCCNNGVRLREIIDRCGSLH